MGQSFHLVWQKRLEVFNKGYYGGAVNKITIFVIFA